MNSWEAKPAMEGSPVREAVLSDFVPSLLFCGILIASGLFHLSIVWLTGAQWEGPLSARKPGLFGVSAGLTGVSIVWVLTQLVPRRYDRSFATLMTGSLLIEVGLITLQYWRGVPSHFNRATPMNAAIESSMLALIVFVTAGIAGLCWRSRQLLPIPRSRAVAIQAGLWLLLISCGLGFLTTILGTIKLSNGQPPELWGIAGVLKYPHGIVLHSIQILPIFSLLLEKFRVPQAVWLLRAAVASQVLLLIHALVQTFSGRARLDLDSMGTFTLVAAGILLLLPLTAIVTVQGSNLIFSKSAKSEASRG
jgi:hypothetical protein